MTSRTPQLREDAGRILRAAVESVDPFRLLASAGATFPISEPATYVIAAGKAAWPMAQAFAQLNKWTVRAGLVAGPRIGSAPLDAAFEWFEAGHPSPNDASVRAAGRALELARRARGEGDARFVLLLSGGASALLAVPAPGITLDDKITTARQLMHAGIPIDGLNSVRKHLSGVKGGQLAAAAGRAVTLAISDVHGPVADDPSVIGSGPTVADPTTFADALRIVEAVEGIPDRVRARLERGAAGEIEETPKPGDPRVAGGVYSIVGNRTTAMDGARRMAESLGYHVVTIGQAIDGEARDAAHTFVERSAAIAGGSGGQICVIGAGETTVTVRGAGKGGRNQELALAGAVALASIDVGDAGAVVLASAGTDGADGPTDAAGAIVDQTTIARATRAGLDWQSTLADNDAYHLLGAVGDLVFWGPTGTNVGDVQLFLMDRGL